MSLSDLDLVNHAMAAEQANYAAAPAPTTNGSNGAAPAPTNSTTTTTTTTSDGADALADIDLSTLSPADRAALQPILDALKAASAGGDELDVEGILQQLDAAGDAADVLEGRLDMLLAHLAQMESAAQAECDDKAQ